MSHPNDDQRMPMLVEPMNDTIGVPFDRSINPTGSEADYEGGRLALMDSESPERTKVFYVEVVTTEAELLGGPLGGQLGDWVSPVAKSLDLTLSVVPVGPEWPAFPNAIEWSSCRTATRRMDTRLYWIGWDRTVDPPLAELRYAILDHLHDAEPIVPNPDDPARVLFADSSPTVDRYLTNCSYSASMEDRILCFVRVDRDEIEVEYDENNVPYVPDPAWEDYGAAWWCVHPEDGGPAQEYASDYVLSDFPPLSGPVRPINDAYAVFIGEKLLDGVWQLRWYDLRTAMDADDPRRTRMVHRYEGPGYAGAKLMGVGSRRAPARDRVVSLGQDGARRAGGFERPELEPWQPLEPREVEEHAYVVYALLQTATESWVDVYEVRTTGPFGGRCPAEGGHAEQHVRVVSAWRLRSPSGTHPWFLDQEDYPTREGGVRLVLTLGTEGTNEAEDTQVWVFEGLYETWEREPGVTEDPREVEVKGAPVSGLTWAEVERPVPEWSSGTGPGELDWTDPTTWPSGVGTTTETVPTRSIGPVGRRVDAEPMQVEGRAVLYYRLQRPSGISVKDVELPINLYHRVPVPT